MVQQLYRGWAWLGVVAVGALRALPLVFFVFAFPANRQTQNWTPWPTGCVAIKRLAVLRGRIDRLSIEQLEVTRLTVKELTVENGQSQLDELPSGEVDG